MYCKNTRYTIFTMNCFLCSLLKSLFTTARKHSVIIWNMVTKNQSYRNPENYLFLDQKRKQGIVKRIQKQINKFGLKADEIEFATN